ncbi:hypothetical protein MKW94_026934, partial [Papaver nudicaule]|nr:hypothetical protein [Papaver nudicaule]
MDHYHYSTDDSSTDDGEHYEIDTSDDDSVVDDDYRIDEAGASTSRSRPIPRRSPRLLALAQRRGKRLMKGVRHFLGKMD